LTSEGNRTKAVILIPTYNSAGTVRETLGSVLAQGAHLERLAAVWVADDCSEDETRSIVNATWDSSVPLQILSAEQNLGERGNVNRAARTIRAAADWMLILHADDVARADWLALMLERIDACDTHVASICSSWDNWMPDGSVRRGEDNVARPVEVIKGDAMSVRGTLKRGCWWHISGCAIRLAALDDVGGFDPRMPQIGDWEWLLRCLARGWWIEYVPRTLIKYRQHTASVSATSSRFDRDVRESLQILRRYASLLSSTALLELHGRRMSNCIRRIMRAVLRRDVRRLVLASQTLWLVGVNLLKVFKEKRKAIGG